MRRDPAQSGVVAEYLHHREVGVERQGLRHAAQARPGHGSTTAHCHSATVRLQQPQYQLNITANISLELRCEMSVNNLNSKVSTFSSILQDTTQQSIDLTEALRLSQYFIPILWVFI